MLEIVRNKPQYWEFIRHLKNDETARTNSMSDHMIQVGEHRAYMSVHNDKYYICLNNSIPVGYVGRNAQDYISVAVISENRGKGIGKYMLQYFREQMSTQKLRAIVSLENPASLKLFEACGFIKKYYIFEGDEND
tara:strand:- start:698 stop:1102 length:405 start_codon:yes stop_codon:yes gene_type:complete